MGRGRERTADGDGVISGGGEASEEEEVKPEVEVEMFVARGSPLALVAGLSCKTGLHTTGGPCTDACTGAVSVYICCALLLLRDCCVVDVEVSWREANREEDLGGVAVAMASCWGRGRETDEVEEEATTAGEDDETTI